jgi:hypothetical protein
MAHDLPSSRGGKLGSSVLDGLSRDEANDDGFGSTIANSSLSRGLSRSLHGAILALSGFARLTRKLACKTCNLGRDLRSRKRNRGQDRSRYLGNPADNWSRLLNRVQEPAEERVLAFGCQSAGKIRDENFLCLCLCFRLCFCFRFYAHIRFAKLCFRFKRIGLDAVLHGECILRLGERLLLEIVLHP